MKVWHAENAVIIRKGSDPFGELLNMTRGFPLTWDGRVWKSSEALYQAARFPDNFQLQEEIRNATNGFTAKLVAKAHKSETRAGWDDHINVRAMRQVLGIKYTQHEKIRELIAGTGTRDIIEWSTRDQFWGAKQLNGSVFEGQNILGKLLMDLRTGIPRQGHSAYLPGASLDEFAVD